MKKLQTKAAIFVSTGALLLYAFVPLAFAQTGTTISGNGSSSSNEVNTKVNQTSTIVQNNDANFQNNIDASAYTGGNKANDNTGGSTTIGTGNAMSTVTVDNRANINKAIDSMPSTNVNGSGMTTISGNGSFTDNSVNSNSNQTSQVFQNNKAVIDNMINANAKTGDNYANRNTGGDSAIITGHAVSDVAVSNAANANLYSSTTSGSTTGTSTGTLGATISGNGSASDSSINLDRNRYSSIVQGNKAFINNNIYAKPNTGFNETNDNTGGSTLIDTGMASALATVDNMANFNVARTDNMISDSFSKIAGNGSFSTNDINANRNDKFDVFQGGEGKGNLFNVNNNVNAKPASGLNTGNRNTAGIYGGDPSVISGHAVSDTMVRNMGNANVYGTEPGLSLGGTNLNFTFDLGSLLNF